MENHYNSPAQIVLANMQSAAAKATLPLGRMMLLGIMAGAFIAFGAEASSLAIHTVSNFGLARAIAGVIFPVGLMLIVLTGGELFTGNCLISMAVYDHRVPCYRMVKNLVVVYFSNLIGSVIVVLLVYGSGQLDFNSSALGAFTIKTAVGKLGLSPVQCFCSGILCNCLVCLAVLMAGAARDAAGKCLGVFFPIAAFVISGFEHCVANMYYLPAGMAAAGNDAYVAKAEELYGLTAEQIGRLDLAGIAGNLFPVTIGNMVGGMVCIGLVYYILHKAKKS